MGVLCEDGAASAMTDGDAMRCWRSGMVGNYAKGSGKRDASTGSKLDSPWSSDIKVRVRGGMPPTRNRGLGCGTGLADADRGYALGLKGDVWSRRACPHGTQVVAGSQTQLGFACMEVVDLTGGASLLVTRGA